ncbi:FliH/SctL family protein [Papillibacter cinnamivorans]|uniref:Flagellar biosynthesis/type III secretory pathway protein FliH n=1 Tax=Papillibacter cinnamivorans DSM 12816 TaxID=1122930 RepID=A0A1W1YHI2_9FIRM|nr:FliH/SctL family protein [Papillibacter cinnamivorans]SMC35619.1 Flagellar biosynthesis/type III secretory pathway protein FliH [Papillibacter cinnamivorans DSM 12816]
MFRIDRNMVYFERKESVYTNLVQAPRPEPQAGEKRQDEIALQKSREALKKAQTELQQMEFEAMEKASGIVSRAEKQADGILEKARDDARGVLDNARETGYAEGLRKADEKIEVSCRKKTDSLQFLITKIEQARASELDGLEGEILSLVMETAKKVINIQLEKDDKLFEGLIKNALAQMKREGKIVIRVSQEDYKRYFPAGSAEFAVGSDRIVTAVAEEPLFRPGDCVIESEGGSVDAGISSQLKYIELAFRSEKGGER